MNRGISDEGMKRIANNVNRKAVSDDPTFEKVDQIREVVGDKEFIDMIFKAMSVEEADSMLDFIIQQYEIRDEWRFWRLDEIFDKILEVFG